MRNLYKPTRLVKVIFALIFAASLSPAIGQYTWIGLSGGTGVFNVPTNWNPARTNPATTDILIFDGSVTSTATVTGVITQTVGQIKLTNSPSVLLQSSASATLTINGNTGTDLDIPLGSTLNINSTSGISIAFTGAQTASIAGTFTASSTGTGLLNLTNCIAAVTGTINNSNAAFTFTSTTANLSFSAGANFNHSGTVTGATLPLATWDPSSNITITGITTATGAFTNNAQTFGNFTWNCTAQTANPNTIFAGVTATIAGNLNVQSTGTGKIRLLGAGTLMVGGNFNVSGGSVDVLNANGNFTVTGAVAISNASTVNMSYNAGIANVGGSFTVSGTSTVNFGNTAGATVITINGNLVYNSSGVSVLAAVSGTTPVLNVLGNFSMSAGQFGLGSVAGAGTLRVGGSFTKTGGAFGVSGTGTTSALEFNGNVQQSVSFNSATVGAVNVKLNNAGGINLTGTLAINASAVYTITAGSTSGSGSVVYDQTSGTLLYNSSTTAQTITSQEFPISNGPVNLVINNTASSPGNQVTMAFNRSLPATGILTLTAGMLNNTGFTLTVPNPAVASLVGGSSGSYITGAIIRALPASLVSGSTYIFPVGKSTYNPLELVNPTTNSGGTVTIKAEVFDASTGGTAGTLMESISTSRYWAATIPSGASFLTGTLLRLNDTRNTLDGIAVSPTLTGVYNHIGGNTSTLTASSITTTAPLITSFAGFFVMGNLSAASFSNLSITPAGNQCVNVARTVTVTVTPGAGAVTSVTLSYQINGGTLQNVTMTNTGGNNWSGTIPTVTPATATVTWSVSATDANSLTKTIAGIPYADQPLTGVTVTASANPTNVCSGSPSILTALVSKPASGQVGTAPSSAGGAAAAFTAGRSFYGSYWGNARQQWLVRSNELSALGFTAGNITALSIAVTATGTPATLQGFTIKMANTTAVTITTAFLTPAFTTVWGAQNYTPVVGTNTHTFTTAFFWDGTSNVVLEVCHSNQVIGSASASDNYSVPGFSCGANYGADGATGAGACAATTVSNTSLASRPVFTLTANIAPAVNSYTWKTGAVVIGTGNPFTVNPVSNTSYTVTVTDPQGCTITSNPITVATSALPSAPEAHNSSQCGTRVPEAFVTSTFSSNTVAGYRWYDAQTGGILLQTGGATYTGSISISTHLWVSETNGTCESLRADVFVAVVAPDQIHATADNLAPCLNSAVQLSVSDLQSTPVNTYSYSWTSPDGVNSGLTGTLNGSSISVIPTAAGTFRYIVKATDADCVTTDTVTLAVKTLPLLNTATATPAGICPGSSATLMATTRIPGTVVIGTGTLQNAASSTTATGYPAPFGNYYQGALNQMLITAAELTAMGLKAGNITSLAFDVATPKTTALAGFSVGIKASSSSSLSTLESGFTTVYSAASYTPSATAGYAANTIAFSIPFNWNGSSNIVVQTCFANTAFSTNAVFNQTATSYVSTLVYRADATTVCTSPGAVTFSYSQRPNIKLAGQVAGAGSLTYSWQPGSLSGSSVVVSPTQTTQYTVTATDQATTCSASAQVNVTVFDLPPSVSATASEQCGSMIPTASVSSNSNASTPVFKWYSAATGGTLLQTGTSPTYLSSISTTTSFYVAEVSTQTCEGPRTEVIVNVITPDPVTVSANPAVICLGGSFDLTATQQDFNNAYVFTWSATPLNSGLPAGSTGSTVTNITPSAAGTYTYLVTATDADKGCVTTASVDVTAGAYPVITNVTALPATTCSGGAVTLTGTTNVVAAGTATIGIATTLTGAAVQPTAFCNRWAQYWSQTVYTAAELTAGGLRAGNITGIAYNISTLGDASTNSNFTIKIATTSGSVVTGFVTAGLNNVYGPATYTHAVGLNIISFSVPYNWDGVSNLLIDVRHDGADLAANARTYYTATTGNTTATATTSTTSATQVLASSNPTPDLSTSRLNINFYGQAVTQGPGPYSWVWNPGNLSGSSVIAHPFTTTAYVATATDPVTGCSANSSPVTVNVVSVTTTASATPNTPVCAGTSVTLNASPTGGGPFSYSWTDGTNILGNTQSIVVSPSITATFSVTVTDACGGTTTASVNVNVNPLPSAIINQAGPISICAPATQVLTASTNSPSPLYQWQNAGTNITGATAASYTVTASGVYTVIVTSSTTSCSSTSSASVTITVNAKPSAVVVTPSTTTVCNGAVVSLTGTVSTVSALSGTGTSTSVGNSGTSTLGPNPLEIYYGGVKQQMVYRAAELSSLGLNNGSTISALKVNLATADVALPLDNLRIKMKNSSTASLSTVWEAGMTVVRTASSYTPVVGLNTLTLTTPFVWDGTSSIVIEITYSNNDGGKTSTPYNTAKYSATSFSSTIFYVEDNATANSLSNYTGAVTFAYNSRTDLTFDYSNPGTIKWAPLTGLYTNAGATTAYTGTVLATVYAKPAVTTNYTATASSASGCTNNGNSVITVNPRPTGILSGGAVYCNGQSTATNLSIAVTGAGPWNGTLSGGLSFSGSVSPIIINVVPSATTTYTIATLNGSACSAVAADLSGTATVTVNPTPATPIITAGGATTFCSGTSVVLTSSSATGNQWNLNGTAITGATNQTLTVSASGNYTVTVTNGNSCSATSAVTAVTVNPTPATPTVTADGPTTFCSGGSVILSSSSATGNQWKLNGTAISGASNQTLTVTASGNYTVTVTAGTCVATSTITTVTVNPTPTTPMVTAGGPTTFCSGGTVVLTSSSATGNQWNLDGTAIAGATNQALTVTASGNYTVTVTAGSCSATSAVTTVTVNPTPATPTVTSGGPTTFCSGGSVVLTSSSATGNQWNLNGTAIAGATNQTLTVTASGDYTVTVTAGTCSATSTITTITVNPTPATPTVTAGGPTTFCSGGSVVLTSSSATGNQWNLNGTAIAGATNQTLTVTASGDYTVTVTNGSNCSATSMVTTVTVNPTPATPTVTAGGPTTFCSGSSVVLTSSATTGNQWNLNGTAIAGATNQTLTVTASGDYTVTVTNGTNCSATSTITTVTVNPTPATPTVTAGGPTTFCSGGSVVLTSSSATGNQWNLNGTAIAGATNQTLTVTASGDYTVTVTNGSNCSATSTITTITVNPTPATPTVTAGGPTTFCSGSSVVLTSSATTGNQWNLNGTAIAGATNQTLTVTASGDYTVTVTNGTNCSATSTITTVTVNPLAANVTATVTQPTCTVASGTVTVTAPLGAGITYSLDGGAYQPGTTFSNVAPGTHTLTAQTVSGCFSPASTSVTVNAQPVTPAAPVVSGIVNVCPYLGTGQQLTYTATAAGATGFTWTLPPHVNLVTGQGTSTLVVTFDSALVNQVNKQLRVKAVSSCGSSAIVIFYLTTQIPAAPAPISGIVNICPYIGTGTVVTYTIPSALSATRYLWSVPAGTTVTHPNIVNPADSIYDTVINVVYNAGFVTGGGVSISVTSRNGCGLSGTRTLQLSAQPAATPGLINGPTNVCANILPGGTAATYSVSPVSGAVSYTWTWPSGATVSYPNGQGVNGYTISVLYPQGFNSGTMTVSATNGCGTGGVRSLSVTKLTPSTPSNIDVIQTGFCGDVQGRVYTYTLSSMPANATSVQWTIPATGATFVSGQGTTSITVSYGNGAVNGNITAQAQNNCGVSGTRSVIVKLPVCSAPGFAGKVQVKEVTAQRGSMEVKIFPNPTVSDFKLEVLSSSKDEVEVRVIDVEGRLYKSFKTAANQTISLGAELKAGSYMVEVRQGGELRTTKLVKF